MLKEVIIFPTDTVYGIGASIYDKKSINKIYEIKGRDFNKPLAVLCNNVEQIKEFAIVTSDLEKLAQSFWPGALTLILKTNDKYKSLFNEETIGVRIPNHDIALKLTYDYGPLKTTSVNNSGEEPLNDYEIIKNRYENIVSTIYENNVGLSHVSSTVVDLTSDQIKVLRQGEITLANILKVLSK